MKIIFSLLLCILMISLSSIGVYADSLSCQYTDIEEYSEEELRFYRGSELLEGKLEIQETQFGCPRARFKVYNPFDFEIEIRIDYLIASSWFGSRKISLSTVIPSNEYKILEGDGSCDTRKVLGYVKLEIVNPGDLTSKLEKVTKQKIICKKCNGVECLNDGSSCTNPMACGGKHCIEGYCSNSELCFNNDCKCALDEIQCDDNERCVKKSIVPIDVKPECNKPQECITGYIDSDSGLCEKSPAQIQGEENQKLKEEMEHQERIQKEEHQRLMDELAQKEKEKKFMMLSIIGLAFLIISGGVVIYILKNKTEKERQKTIRKEIELEAKKIESKEFELNDLKKQISDIKKHKKLEKKEVERLNHLKSKTDKLIKDIDNQYKQITTPFFDGQVLRKVIIVPEIKGDYITWQGYKCFYKEGRNLDEYTYNDLVHIWVWRKHNDNRLPRKGFHIHHNDHNKLNNNPKNLEEVEGKEHYEMHRTKYTD